MDWGRKPGAWTCKSSDFMGAGVEGTKVLGGLHVHGSGKLVYSIDGNKLQFQCRVIASAYSAVNCWQRLGGYAGNDNVGRLFSQMDAVAEPKPALNVLRHSNGHNGLVLVGVPQDTPNNSKTALPVCPNRLTRRRRYIGRGWTLWNPSVWGNTGIYVLTMGG